MTSNYFSTQSDNYDIQQDEENGNKNNVEDKEEDVQDAIATEDIQLQEHIIQEDHIQHASSSEENVADLQNDSDEVEQHAVQNSVEINVDDTPRIDFPSVATSTPPTNDTEKSKNKKTKIQKVHLATLKKGISFAHDVQGTHCYTLHFLHTNIFFICFINDKLNKNKNFKRIQNLVF